MQNAAPRLLRSDGPHSMRSFVRKFGLAVFWSAAEHLNKAAITGQPALSEYGFWDYFVAHPEASRIFNEAMAGKANAVVPDLLAGYDFSQFSVIGGFGGGTGHPLRAILDKCAETNGVLVDRPRVAEQASAIATEHLSIRG